MIEENLSNDNEYFPHRRFLWYSRHMKRQPQPTPTEAARLLVTVPSSDIAYFHAILEGYDDLGVMRTLAPDEGLLEVCVSPGREGEFRLLLEALRAEGVLAKERRE